MLFWPDIRGIYFSCCRACNRAMLHPIKNRIPVFRPDSASLLILCVSDVTAIPAAQFNRPYFALPTGPLLKFNDIEIERLKCLTSTLQELGCQLFALSATCWFLFKPELLSRAKLVSGVVNKKFHTFQFFEASKALRISASYVENCSYWRCKNYSSALQFLDEENWGKIFFTCLRCVVLTPFHYRFWIFSPRLCDYGKFSAIGYDSWINRNCWSSLIKNWSLYSEF